MEQINKPHPHLDADFLDIVLGNLPQGVCVTDIDGNFLYVNNTLCFFLGYSKQTLLGFNAHQMVEDGLIQDNLIADVLVKKKTVTKMLNVLRADNTHIQLLQTERPIFDADGNIMFAVSVLRDVENEKRLLQTNESIGMSIKKELLDQKEQQLVYKSKEMQQIIDSLSNICSTNVPILLQGDSGTGKEVLANYIHRNSSRANKPMICINCAALPESLLESELFGYERGAFTGAAPKGKMGIFESAHGATLFLDEINSLPLSLQPKLLRVLETNTLQRIGSTKPKHIDFRLIVATNKKLEDCVKAGTFRIDLMYRINAFTINIPPLSERPDDIIPLANSFLEFFCRKYIVEKHFSDHVYEQLLHHDWPGNVRELKNTIEKIVLTSDHNTKTINVLPDTMLGSRAEKRVRISPHTDLVLPKHDKAEAESFGITFWDRSKTLDDNMAYYEQAILEDAYEAAGSTTAVANMLGINQATASRKLNKYGISKKK